MLEVVLAVIAGGLGLPVPEDLALLTAGYLLWRGGAPLGQLAPAAIAAVVASDALLYGAGRLLINRPGLRRRFGGARVERLERVFARHGAKVVLVARFAIGCRAPFFLAAGVGRMPLMRLLAWDALGAAAVVALWLAIGVRFGPELERLRGAILFAAKLLPVLIAVLLAGELLRRSIARRRGVMDRGSAAEPAVD